MANEMKLNKPRNQHIVPVLSLEYFADLKRHVWTYRKDDNRVWHRRPEDTAKIAHYYSFECEDGTMDTTIEETFSVIEGAATEPYRKLARGQMVSGKEKHDFAYFLGIQVARTPTQRRINASICATVMQTQLAAQVVHEGAFKKMSARLQEEGINVDNEEELKTALLDLSRYNLAVPKEMLLPALSVGDKLAAIFGNMSWMLFQPEGHYFVTCDNPVYRAVDPKTCHPILGDHGYLNKSAQVTFPLTPKMLLLMTYGRLDRHDVFSLARDFVQKENAKRAYNAEYEVYSHTDDKRVARLVNNHRAMRPDVKGGDFAGSKPFHTIEVPRKRKR